MSEEDPPKRILAPEAQRALAEAEARRKKADALAHEIGGPSGPEPTRYGTLPNPRFSADWERKGIAVDF